MSVLQLHTVSFLAVDGACEVGAGGDHQRSASPKQDEKPIIMDHLHQLFITKNAVLCHEVKKNFQVRARLHQASESMLRQLCNDASDTVLIENNGVT